MGHRLCLERREPVRHHAVRDLPACTERRAARSDVAARSGRLWSLTAFDDAYLQGVGAKGAPRSDPLGTLVGSMDQVERALLGELARRSLLAAHWRQLRWYQPERLAYFRLYEEGKERKLRWSAAAGVPSSYRAPPRHTRGSRGTVTKLRGSSCGAST